jgi:polygalacturonase
VSIDNADGLTITDMTIDDSDGDTEGGANTDGFDIGSSTNVIITGANVYNQDDCVAINSGTEITVENSVCSGGHGLSIGSVGGRDDNTVETVTFYNNEVKSSVNGKTASGISFIQNLLLISPNPGIRIKATEGDTGSITGVTYSEITLEDISGYVIFSQLSKTK